MKAPGIMLLLARTMILPTIRAALAKALSIYA